MEAKATDGSEKMEGVVRTMPVVVVKEKREAFRALSGGGIGMDVGLLAERV